MTMPSGLASTANDYGRFLRMLLRGGTLDGQRILSPAIVAYMTADHLGHDIGRSNYYPPGPGYGFGLGFAVRVAAGEAPFSGIGRRLFLERRRWHILLG